MAGSHSHFKREGLHYIALDAAAEPKPPLCPYPTRAQLPQLLIQAVEKKHFLAALSNLG
jgi:hypothetical protein